MTIAGNVGPNPPAGTDRGRAGPLSPFSGEAALTPPMVLFRLLKLSNLITRPFFAHFAGRYELSHNDLRVLMTLAMVPEAASHELSAATGMHPMNVSRSVASLTRQGRVVARRDPANRRRKILTLTEEGWRLERALMPHVRRIAGYLFASMSPLETEFLSKLIDLLTARLEEVDPNSPVLIDEAALSLEPAPKSRRPRRRSGGDEE